jgi:V/A-type H+-transporting ATPase subunit K
MCAVVLLFPDMLCAAGEVALQPNTGEGETWKGAAYLAAALAVGLACIGSGFAVARIGSSGLGALAEKPELMGRALVFLGLAEGISIYGLIIAIMILNKL